MQAEGQVLHHPFRADVHPSPTRGDDGAMSVIGPPVQIAYAVRDVHEAAARWVAERGAGPFFVAEHIEVVDVRYRGAPATFDHSSAYGQWGAIMVELVCDHTEGPSAVADVVGPGGTGLHHVAHFVDDFDAGQRELAARGWTEAMRASTTTGNTFAFHDATAELGHMVEIYVATPGLRGFYAMVAGAAQAWDGADPVRSVRR